ncbi:MAG: T9SS type A sorting domain-containing protein [Bacteroidota bacterium]|nr:T9SS type A sorting domain-containing protein [Bacteroidota bacterium]
MKLKHLLFAASLSIGLCAEAQIHPASVWSMTQFYNAPANHTKEVWSIGVYTYYSIDITRDGNNYITNMTSSTPPPLSASQFKCTGSKTGNVYTATSQKNQNGGAFSNWRRDTWQSDGTNDTLIMWEDYDTVSSTWKSNSKQTLTYSSGLITTMIGYSWSSSTSAWVNLSKNDVTYISGKKDRINNFNWDNVALTWKDNGYIQYYYTGNKMDSMQEWSKDQSTGITSLKYRFIITSDANNKTASFQQLKWKESASIWENSLNISFTSGTTGNNELTGNEMISVYPIPASDALTIQINNATLNNAVVKLYSLDGKEVLHTNISENQSTLNTSGLSNGMYVLCVENNGLKLHQQKLMVAH